MVQPELQILGLLKEQEEQEQLLTLMITNLRQGEEASKLSKVLKGRKKLGEY